MHDIPKTEKKFQCIHKFQLHVIVQAEMTLGPATPNEILM